MAEIPESLEHMLAAWNEPEPSRVRDHLNKALSADVRFVDPSIDISGVDGFEANVHKVRSRLPGATYSRTSGVDSQHSFHRYHWAIHRGEELVLAGFDVVQTDDAGRVVLVIGFFGHWLSPSERTARWCAALRSPLDRTDTAGQMSPT